MSVKQVYDRWRALSEVIGVRLSLSKKVIQLVTLLPLDTPLPIQLQDYNCKEGFAVYDKAKRVVWIKFSDGWIAVSEFHVDSARRKASAADFANGYRLISSSKLMPEISGPSFCDIASQSLSRA